MCVDKYYVTIHVCYISVRSMIPSVFTRERHQTYLLFYIEIKVLEKNYIHRKWHIYILYSCETRAKASKNL